MSITLSIPADVSLENPQDHIKIIESELYNYSESLINKPRWLVFNKIDLLFVDDLDKCKQNILQHINWDGPIFWISAVTGKGTKELCQNITNFIKYKL